MHVPARHVFRGALGAVVFAGAAALAVLGLPAAGESVGVVAASRPLLGGVPVVADERGGGIGALLASPAPPPSLYFNG